MSLVMLLCSYLEVKDIDCNCGTDSKRSNYWDIVINSMCSQEIAFRGRKGLSVLC